MRDRQTIPRLTAATVGGVALLLWAGPAAAQVVPVPPEACGALDTVGDTVGTVQDTVEGTTGQDLPADGGDTVGTVGSTAGCPQAAAPGDESGSDSTSATSTTAYQPGSAGLGASSALPRTGGPAALVGTGSLAVVAAAVIRLLLRRAV